jgi:lactoylglutathione lyase
MNRPERPSSQHNQKLITFLYYHDLSRAIRFYEDVMGLTLEIDQGWSKIYRVTSEGYIGLVDESRGSHRAHPVKPVQICLRVENVDAWFAFAQSSGLNQLTQPRSHSELKIRAFTFDDPEGYQIEIQSSLE